MFKKQINKRNVINETSTHNGLSTFIPQEPPSEHYGFPTKALPIE